MIDDIETQIERYRLTDGDLLLGTTSEITVGTEIELVARLETRYRETTVENLSIVVSVLLPTAGSVEEHDLLDVTVADELSVESGFTTVERTSATVPHTTPVGFGAVVPTATVSFDLGERSVEQRTYLDPRVTPSLSVVIDELTDAGYAVADSRLVPDRTESARSFVQSILFNSTATAATTEPVTVFVRSSETGLSVASAVDRADGSVEQSLTWTTIPDTDEQLRESRLASVVEQITGQ